jgi:UDP-N-acetylglucosamine 4,6-dehydratase
MATLFEAIAPGHPVIEVGFRPGEKRHEQLLNQHEAPHALDLLDHFVLRSLAGTPVGALPASFEYRSDLAPHLGVVQLRHIIEAMDRGESVRTLGERQMVAA